MLRTCIVFLCVISQISIAQSATCPTNEIDLAVFIDSSDAVSFQSMLSFANQVIADGFNVGSNAVRVAVAQYTFYGDIAISLGQYTDSTSLQAAISRISYVQTSQSFLTSAFGNIHSMFTNSPRTGAASLLLYLTNRAPVDTYDQLSSTMSALQSAGIRLVTVGAFEPDNSMRQLLSYYYDMILVNGCTLTRANVNQATFSACPLKGATGMPGKTGATGHTGATGATGMRGLPGSRGPDGATGYTGATGFTGSVGALRMIGDTGSTGATGATGLKGMAGNPETAGFTGSRGSPGRSGSTGATGLPGPWGFPGNIGQTGFSGAAGAIGATGATGSTGFTGVGATGATGLRGRTGATGNSAPYPARRRRRTLADDEDCQGPEGPTGDEGMPGAIGPFGGTGASGFTGPAGAMGPYGPQGAMGATGASGAGAVRGQPGSVGQTGWTGATGPLYSGAKKHWQFQNDEDWTRNFCKTQIVNWGWPIEWSSYLSEVASTIADLASGPAAGTGATGSSSEMVNGSCSPVFFTDA